MASVSDEVPYSDSENVHVCCARCLWHESCVVCEIAPTMKFVKKHAYDKYTKIEFTVLNFNLKAVRIYEPFSLKKELLDIEIGKGKPFQGILKPELKEVTLTMSDGVVHHVTVNRNANNARLILDVFSYSEQSSNILILAKSILSVHFDSVNPNIVPFGIATAKRSKDILSERSYCDVTLDLPNGESIEAHSQILALRSPVFEAMLHSGMKEALTNRITIEDSTPEVVKLFVAFLYTGQLPSTVTVEDCKGLLAMGHKYQVEDLQEVAASVLGVNADPENVIESLILAERYSRDLLKRRCLQLIRDNAKKLLGTPGWDVFFKTYPDLCNDILKFIVGCPLPKRARIAN